ncbi:MAG TPA: hypothetical protein VNR62_00480, partial [Cellulomonas sp.]|nr:hypothetical protein [Cellulomonas sp.]
MGGRSDHDVRSGAARGTTAAVLATVVVLASADAGFPSVPEGIVIGAQVVGVTIALFAGRHPLGALLTCLAISVAVPLGATPVVAYVFGRSRAPARSTSATVVGGVAVVSGLWLLAGREIDADRVITYVT